MDGFDRDQFVSAPRSTEDDPGSRKTLDALAFTLLLLLAAGPMATDLIESAELHYYFANKLDVIIAPQPDRLRSDWVSGDYRDLNAALAEAALDDRTSGEGEDKPLGAVTFFTRAQVLWKSFQDWLRAPSGGPGSAESQAMFLGLLLILGFMVASYAYGTERVTMFLNGLCGPARLKKIIIDLFVLKGVERTVFPSIRNTIGSDNNIASSTVNRIDVTDVVRISVGIQGEGHVTARSTTLTMDGKSAYCFCPGTFGGGGDYYFNLTRVTAREVKIIGDFKISRSTKKGSVGRVKFDIYGFKAAAWQ